MRTKKGYKAAFCKYRKRPWIKQDMVYVGKTLEIGDCISVFLWACAYGQLGRIEKVLYNREKGECIVFYVAYALSQPWKEEWEPFN